MTKSLPGVRPTVRNSLRAQIVEALRAAVVAGELRPGEVYSARSLAVQFRVSATPVREAMLDLVREELFESLPNQGYRVRDLDQKDLDEISEVRTLLEVPTVRALAARRIGSDVMAELHQLAGAVEEAAREGDAVAHVLADRAFHLRLLSLSGNGRLVRLVGRLRSQARVYGLAVLEGNSRLVDASHEHTRLLTLLDAGDEDAVEALMREHIGHVRQEWAPTPVHHDNAEEEGTSTA